MADEVIIQEVAAKVRVLDSSSLLNPRTLSLIVAATLQASEEEKRLAQRQGADTKLPGSGRDELA